MNTNVNVTIAQNGEDRSILGFYESVGENIRIVKPEKIIIAKEESQIVGAVRLVDEGDYFVLRTLNVSQYKQGQGIGKSLIEHLLELVPNDKSLYCLAYPHVQGFYTFFGFKGIFFETLPKKLKRRYLSYIKEFKVIALERVKI